MLPYEDVQIQLVELPALQFVESEGQYRIRSDSANLIRQSDGLLIVVDLTNGPLRQLELVVSSLETIRISTRKEPTRVEIVPEKGSGEIRIAYSGSRESVQPEQVRRLLHSYGIKNALVRIFGEVTLDDIEDAIFENITLYKPTVVLANKLDLDRGQELSSHFLSNARGFNATAISCMTGHGLNLVGRQLFETLRIVRVYTKEPSASKPSEHPFVVPAGTTVRELARSIHTDLANRYRYSRIWGPTSKFAGERVGPDHILGDQDIVEIHTE
jgi:ribosome-interacting GTPase 1